jgi:hypothetical protein
LENKESQFSRLKKLDQEKRGLPHEPLKKGFSAVQKILAFIGSFLSIIIATFTINNNLGSKKSETQQSTPQSTEVVKVIERSSEINKDSSSIPSSSKGEENIKSDSKVEEKKVPEKETVIREIIREVPQSSSSKEVIPKDQEEIKKEGSVTKENKANEKVDSEANNSSLPKTSNGKQESSTIIHDDNGAKAN